MRNPNNSTHIRDEIAEIVHKQSDQVAKFINPKFGYIGSADDEATNDLTALFEQMCLEAIENEITGILVLLKDDGASITIKAIEQRLTSIMGGEDE